MFICWSKSGGRRRSGAWFYIVLFPLKLFIEMETSCTIVSEGPQKVFAFHVGLLCREGSLSCHPLTLLSCCKFWIFWVYSKFKIYNMTLLWIWRDSHQISFRTVQNASHWHVKFALISGWIMPCFIILSNQLLLNFKDYK